MSGSGAPSISGDLSPSPGLLATILDSVADGILTADADLRITSFNRAAERITGWSRQEALGRSCLEVFSQILVGEECLICRALEKQEYVTEQEREIRPGDGEDDSRPYP